MPIEFLGMGATNDGSETTPRSGGSFDLEFTIRLARAHQDHGWDRVLTDPDGRRWDTGQLRVDPGQRLVRADGSGAPRRFALGMHTTVKAAAFARPCSNAPVHRLNDQVARTLLALPRAGHPTPHPDPTAALSGAGGR